MIIVRFADDFVVGFQYRQEAVQFLNELRTRFAQFGLELHPDKSRLVEFGHFARQNRQERGEGRPETFNFLGFTHCCARTRQGNFFVLRQTMRTTLQAKVQALKVELRRRMHLSIPEQGAYLRSVLIGHVRYYGVHDNGARIGTFRKAIIWLWWRVLERRSQCRVSWRRLKQYVERWLPPAKVCHPYPIMRFGIRSRMREFCTSGSVEGAVGNRRPYSDQRRQSPAAEEHGLARLTASAGGYMTSV